MRIRNINSMMFDVKKSIFFNAFVTSKMKLKTNEKKKMAIDWLKRTNEHPNMVISGYNMKMASRYDDCRMDFLVLLNLRMHSVLIVYSIRYPCSLASK